MFMGYGEMEVMVIVSERDDRLREMRKSEVVESLKVRVVCLIGLLFIKKHLPWTKATSMTSV